MNHQAAGQNEVQATLDSIGTAVPPSEVRSTEAEMHYPARRLDAGEATIEKPLRMCAWCQRLEMDKRWVEDKAVSFAPGSKTVSHGICLACYAHLANSLQ
ncbi:MAG: hypothetical protein KatS3mg105_4199 [Gemmatales bacterium]|nr:MAG: hypothetical protein KatS3mg105_4199 [Gemmatales bacterium]